MKDRYGAEIKEDFGKRRIRRQKNVKNWNAYKRR